MVNQRLRRWTRAAKPIKANAPGVGIGPITPKYKLSAVTHTLVPLFAVFVILEIAAPSERNPTKSEGPFA